MQLWYAVDGRFYVSCSVDGAIKIWDGASSRCVNTIAGAHGGTEVCERGGEGGAGVDPGGVVLDLLCSMSMHQSTHVGCAWARGERW